MQFHPVAYIVKLNIEMSMAELITKVAQSPNHTGPSASASTRGGRLHVSLSVPSASARHRSWYKGPDEVKGEQSGRGQKRWSDGKPVRLDVVGDGRARDAKSPTSPTAGTSEGEYYAWVHAGPGRRDVESGIHGGRGTHYYDEDDDDNDNNMCHGELHGLGLMDLTNSEAIVEGVILKTMETVVTTKSMDSLIDTDTERGEWDRDSGHRE